MFMDRMNEYCVVKMSILPKTICTVNELSIKILMAFFIEIEKTILNFVWRYKDPEYPKQS